MALPTLESAWTHVNNTQLVYTTEANMTAQIFWRMTRALVACPGAQVRFSSGAVGTSVGVDGVDHLTNFSDVQARTTTETTANTSYIVVRLTGVSATFEVCIAHASAATSSISISMSIGGNFVQAATPTHHPTATDRGYAPSTFGTVALLNSAANKRFHYSYTTAGDQLRFLVTTETTLAFNTLTEIGLCDGQYTSAWTGPEAHITHCSVTTAGMTNTSAKSRFGITFASAVTGQYWGHIYGIHNAGVVPADNANEWPISPLFGMPILSSAQQPIVCRFKDIFGVTAAIPDASYFPNPGAKSFIVMGDLLLPWDGSVLL